MKKLVFLFIALGLCMPAFAKDLCKRFPNDTAVECYTPGNPPPSPDLSSYLTSATAASTYAPILEPLSLHLDQTTPQTTVGTFTFPKVNAPQFNFSTTCYLKLIDANTVGLYMNGALVTSWSQSPSVGTGKPTGALCMTYY